MPEADPSQNAILTNRVCSLIKDHFPLVAPVPCVYMHVNLDLSIRALSGRIKFAVRRHKFNKDSPSWSNFIETSTCVFWLDIRGIRGWSFHELNDWIPLWAFSRLASPGVCERVPLWDNSQPFEDTLQPVLP